MRDVKVKAICKRYVSEFCPWYSDDTLDVIIDAVSESSREQLIIGYLSNVEYIRELAEMGVIDIDVALEKVSSISKGLKGSVVSCSEEK